MTISGGSDVNNASSGLDRIQCRRFDELGDRRWSRIDVDQLRGGLIVGYSGTGALNVTGGGSVSSDGRLYWRGSRQQRHGDRRRRRGQLHLDQLSATSMVGVSGTGALNVTGGGSVSNIQGYIGQSPGGNGTATVGGGTGSSAWTNSGIPLVWVVLGAGALNVTGGGSVSNTAGIIGVFAGSNGTATVGGGTGAVDLDEFQYR